jgi:RNA polymerase sigma-70 factor, ECF subfamily
MLGESFDEVLTAAQDADGDAFAALWRDTQPMLLRYLRVLAGDDAEDLASQTWVRVMQALRTFTGNEPQFRRWVVTIARNLHLDARRSAGRRREVPADDLTDLGEEGLPDAGTLVEERMSTDAALRTIASLPPAQAELVMLRVVLGLEVAEVAEIVRKRPGAVRVGVHRALRTLEQRLSRPPHAHDVTPSILSSFFEHDA